MNTQAKWWCVLAKTLDITLYTPHPKQKEVHNNKSRFKVLNWGRRTGKSVFVINYTLLKAIESPGRYWIVAPTYKQAKNIYWYDIVIHHVPKELIAKKNESELIITLINGATIELKGADNEDSLRGAGVKGLVLDEYAFMKPHVWDLILRPMLADSQGWAVFISTPDGYNHFYDIANVAQSSEQVDWYYSHATSYDNPHVVDSEIDSIKQNMNEDQFAQEYLAEFRKMQGLVYPQFERETHVVPVKDIPTEGTHYLSVDFGFHNPTSVHLYLVDYDNNLWVYDEIYRAGMTTEQLATAIKAKMGDKWFRYKIGDAAAAQEIANLNASPYLLGIEPSEKGNDSVKTGIRLVSDRLKIQGNGKPRLFVGENCTNMIWEFESYRYPNKKEDKNESEDPIKENDHAMDDLRGLCIMLDHEAKPIRVHKPQNMVQRKRGNY